MRSDMVQAYVRDLLETITGDRPEPDDDGDFPVAYLEACFYVRVVGSGAPIVQVFSVAVADLESTLELTSALNEINQQIEFARAFHVVDQVLVESEIWGSDVNPDNFQHACQNIATETDRFAPKLVEAFGGTPRFEISKSPDYSTNSAEDEHGSGLYL